MNNKIIMIVLVVIFLGGGVFFFSKINKTPSQKVEDLKTDVAKQQETSGYNACLQKIKDQELNKKLCITDKVAAKGFIDGIDCIQNYTNPVCKDSARYNAEVNASNECNATASAELTQENCTKLLQK